MLVIWSFSHLDTSVNKNFESIWVRLYIGSKESDDPIKIKPVPDDISDLKEAVKAKAGPTLDHYGIQDILGGLLDRESSKSDFIKGIRQLASQRGRGDSDKKDIPILALAVPSESGKTEFLKWIHNNCCTFLAGENTKMAQSVLESINGASPEDTGVQDVEHVLVLFASFNQSSVFLGGYEDEHNITQTTIERFLRSYQGDIKMDSRTTYTKRHFDGFENMFDIVDRFEEVRGNTAFIFCIDELSKLKHGN